MIRLLSLALVSLSIVVSPLSAQSVPTPREYFGFDIGEDRKLANWENEPAHVEAVPHSWRHLIEQMLDPRANKRPDANDIAAQITTIQAHL